MAGEKQARYKQLHFYIKITLLVWGLALVTFFVFPQQTTQFLTGWFEPEKNHQPTTSVSCIPPVDYSAVLNDKVTHHWQLSFKNGIQTRLKTTKGIQWLFDHQKIVRIDTCAYFTVAQLTHSYPFAVSTVKQFLTELGQRFQLRLTNTSLANAKFELTSLLRTEHSLKRLRRINRNATKNSTHLHGTTIDIAYDTFHDSHNQSFSNEVVNYLKEQLAATLIDMRNEKKCWVLYERFQPCFHVVVR
uniref:DUF5715 family protein n=1 Tax=Fluviicola sp. TaxID=1917219 RepID=UPI00404913C6